MKDIDKSSNFMQLFKTIYNDHVLQYQNNSHKRIKVLIESLTNVFNANGG